MKNYNIKELKDKLEKCRNLSLDEVSIDDVDELSSVKINMIDKQLMDCRFYK